MSLKHYCSAFGCLHNSSKNRNLSFFTLPMDIERRRKWLTLIDREDLLEKIDSIKPRNYLVCSAHFEDSSMKIIKHLKKDAVPTIFFTKQPQESSSCLKAQSTSAGTTGKVTIPSNQIIEQSACCTEARSSSAEFKGEVPILLKKKIHVNAETQTETLQSIEKQIQTPKSFTDKTPRKHKLHKDLKDSNLKRRRLDHEITKIEKELEAKNKSITCNDPEDEIGRRFKKLIEWQNKTINKCKENRYDAEYKAFALNLHYSSPHAYRCLQKVLKLPSKGTLNRFKINIPPKLDDRVLESLSLKIKSLPDAAKYCTICVDEMTLKRNLYYNVKTDDIDRKKSPDIASNAFVIMLQGIYYEWKQAIACALLASAKHYEEIDSLLNEVITKLSGIGIKIKAIISDQGSNFDKFAKEIKNVSIDKPYFVYDQSKIYYIFDVPHLIKCIRNNLLTSDFQHNGKKISWEHIEKLYKDQKERNLRLIPKITDAHIQPNNFQKMRVKLAVQTLSRTVSAALHTYIDLGKICEEARPTAYFIELMNNLFDILNSSMIKCNNKFKTAFRLNKCQETVLHDALQTFSTIKALNRKTGKNNTGHIKSFINFQISINSIKMLFEDLKKDGFKYLLTKRLNQDHLENLLESSPNRNCEMDICDILLKAEDMVKTTFASTTTASEHLQNLKYPSNINV